MELNRDEQIKRWFAHTAMTRRKSSPDSPSRGAAHGSRLGAQFYVIENSQIVKCQDDAIRGFLRHGYDYREIAIFVTPMELSNLINSIKV